MIDVPDLINGLFEMAGAACLCLNVRQLWRDQHIAGVHWAPTVFFFLWGVWNCLYYPSLGQWFSLAGGVCILLANIAWLGSLVWFTTREAPPPE